MERENHYIRGAARTLHCKGQRMRDRMEELESVAASKSKLEATVDKRRRIMIRIRIREERDDTNSTGQDGKERLVKVLLASRKDATGRMIRIRVPGDSISLAIRGEKREKGEKGPFLCAR